jgi:hypothetical protein
MVLAGSSIRWEAVVPQPGTRPLASPERAHVRGRNTPRQICQRRTVLSTALFSRRLNRRISAILRLSHRRRASRRLLPRLQGAPRTQRFSWWGSRRRCGRSASVKFADETPATVASRRREAWSCCQIMLPRHAAAKFSWQGRCGFEYTADAADAKSPSPSGRPFANTVPQKAVSTSTMRASSASTHSGATPSARKFSRSRPSSVTRSTSPVSSSAVAAAST